MTGNTPGFNCSNLCSPISYHFSPSQSNHTPCVWETFSVYIINAIVLAEGGVISESFPLTGFHRACFIASHIDK